MGNAGSGGVPKERQKSGETAPSSPCKEEQAFTFGKKPEPKLMLQGSQEDEEPYFTKPVPPRDTPTRIRANTVSEGQKITISDKTPTVFRWEGNIYNILHIFGYKVNLDYY